MAGMMDFSIDTSGSPQDVQRKQALADALMKQGMDSSPAAGGKNGGWMTALNRGLAGALGGYQRGQADQLSQANRQSERDLLASYPGMNPVAAAAPMGNPVGNALTQAAPAADTTGKIYNNDEPSPLDPPSGDDRKKMLATILGEESTAPGQAGVANVIRNRAVDGGYGGDTPSAVVQSPKQFEPWSTEAGRARMAAALQNPAQVAAADNAIKMAYGEGGKAPEDPTEGKTMFYAPGAQAALGRAPPAWAKGEGQLLGKSMFYDDNSDLPKNAQPAQGQLPTQVAGTPVPDSAPDPQAARRQELQAWAQRAALSSNPSIRQMAVTTLEQLNKQQGLINAGAGKIYDPTSKTWLTPPKDPEADIPDNFEKGPDGILRPVKGGPADPEYIAKAAGAKTNSANALADDDAHAIASRYVTSGNRMELTGLGVGNVGSTNRAKVNRFINEIQKDRGLSDEEMANRQAEWEGRKAGQRALGTMETKMGVPAFEAKGAIQLARGAIEKVPRTNFLPFNKLIEGYQTQTLNPDQAELYTRTQGIINTYASVLARGANVTTDAARHRAEELVKTASNPEVYNRVLDTMESEINMAVSSPQKMREFYKEHYGKGGIAEATGGTSQPAASAPAKAAGPEEGTIAHNPTTGESLIRKGGKWVPMT